MDVANKLYFSIIYKKLQYGLRFLYFKKIRYIKLNHESLKSNQIAFQKAFWIKKLNKMTELRQFS